MEHSDPFGTEDGTAEVPFDAPPPRENTPLDDQWREASANEFQRPRVCCPIVFAGPTSRTVYDALCRATEDRGRSTVVQVGNAALKSFVSAVAGSTTSVTNFLAARRPAPSTPEPTRLIRTTDAPVTGLRANKFAARVVMNHGSTTLGDSAAALAAAMASLDDSCLEKSTLRFIHAPSLSAFRRRSTGVAVPQRQDALHRAVAACCALGSVHVVCASLDQLLLKCATTCRSLSPPSPRDGLLNRHNATFRSWFRDVDAVLDGAFAASADRSPAILVLQQSALGDGFSEEAMITIITECFALAREFGSERAAIDTAECTSAPACEVAAAIAIKLQYGPVTATGAARGELAVTGFKVVCSAVNCADGPLRVPGIGGCEPLSIESPADVLECIDALALHVGATVSGSPTCLVPQPVFDCCSALNEQRAAYPSAAVSSNALRLVFTNAGVGASDRRRALRLLHLWGELVVLPYDATAIDDATADADADTHDSTGGSGAFCWRPDLVFDAASALATKFAPMLRPTDVASAPATTDPDTAPGGASWLVSRIWGAGAATTMDGSTTARGDEDDFEPEADRVQDRTCVVTAADAFLLLYPMLSRIYGREEVYGFESDNVTELLASTGLLVKMKRRKATIGTSADRAFDDRMQRLLSPPFVSRMMPDAMPHLFAVLATAGGFTPTWIRVNVNPCTVISSLLLVLSDRLVINSVCFGARGPTNAASVWANGLVFSSIDSSGRSSRTLVAAAIDHATGSPLPALFVATVGCRVADERAASGPDIGVATVDESLRLVSATLLPGLRYWAATPCPSCLKRSLPGPDTDWVAGWVHVSESSAVAQQDGPAATSSATISPIVSTTRSVWFFSDEVLKELRAARRETRERSGGGGAGGAFPCPTCHANHLERSIRSRALKVVTGNSPDEYVAEVLPAFLPAICSVQWRTAWQAANEPPAETGSQEAVEADASLCLAIDALTKSLLFLVTFERPPASIAHATKQATEEEEWDHVDEAS